MHRHLAAILGHRLKRDELLASPHISRHLELHTGLPISLLGPELAMGLDPRGLASGLVHQLTSNLIGLTRLQTVVGNRVDHSATLSRQHMIPISLISSNRVNTRHPHRLAGIPKISMHRHRGARLISQRFEHHKTMTRNRFLRSHRQHHLGGARRCSCRHRHRHWCPHWFGCH